jgi:predicted nucleotidyltransferase
MAAGAMDENALNPKIAEAVRRLVEFYGPERIYLFGSAARGELGPDSDLDFLVVVPDDCPRELRMSGRIYEELSEVEVPIDVVPWRHTDFEGRQVVKSSLPATVAREGKLLYDADTVSGR